MSTFIETIFFLLDTDYFVNMFAVLMAFCSINLGFGLFSKE